VTRVSLAIIGAGASAVALLHALDARDDLEPGDLAVYDPAPHFWRGRAYQPDDDCVRVNSVPTDMSVVPGDTAHLTNWLQAREIMLGTATFVDELSGSVFAPRAVYGDYLEQAARQALLSLGRRGWRFDLIRERVTGIAPAADGLMLSTATGARTVDYAVLATGAGQPTDVYGLTGAPGFVADPYPVGRILFGLPPEASVLVIGTGLTAVDVALGLRAKRHRGPIRLASRSGSLPGVRQAAAPLELRHFTTPGLNRLRQRAGGLTVAAVVGLMRQELAHHGEDPVALLEEILGLREEGAVERLRRHLGQVHDSSVALRLLQQAVPEVGPDIWPYLAGHEQDGLLRAHYRTIMSLCCPMPPASARALLELADRGQLTVDSDLQSVLPGSRGFEVTVAGRTSHADVVVSAVNARVRGFSPGAASLLGSLSGQALATSHHRGGLVTRRADSRAERPDRQPSRLYALGDPASGSLFFTFGVQSLVDRAVDIARDLALRTTFEITAAGRSGAATVIDTQGAPA